MKMWVFILMVKCNYHSSQMSMNNNIVEFIHSIYPKKDVISLHAPTFLGNEKNYVNQTIESTFVSSVGKFVDSLEEHIEHYTKAVKAIATVNGSSALHIALLLAGVKKNDLVLTQALTFVATCNAIKYTGADPVFIDVDKASLGLCPSALEKYLDEHSYIHNGECHHKATGQRIAAVMPMHTFGHPVDLDAIIRIAEKWNLILIEDAAESLGSLYRGNHTGTFGNFGVLSFNGNKIITTGGGGAVLCKTQGEGERAKHITTTAKVKHSYEFYHDELGFNYRMPNINAALGCAQFEVLDSILANKRNLANQYQAFFKGSDFSFVKEPRYAKSNYWLNAIVCPTSNDRDELLKDANEKHVMLRPVWQLMHRLPMFKNALRGDLKNSEWLESRLICLPSSPVGINHV